MRVKKITLIFILLLIGVNMYAQHTISSIFISMPDSVLYSVDAEQKAELTLNSDSTEVVVAGKMNEEIVRTALTNNYMKLKTSDAGVLEIMLLPLVNNTSIVGVIRTVCSSVCDSDIAFYTTEWKPLDVKGLFPDKKKEWFLREDVDINSEGYKNAASVLDMTPIKLGFSPTDNSIIAEYEIEGYLTSEDYKLLEPFLKKESKVLKWDKLSYKEK